VVALVVRLALLIATDGVILVLVLIGVVLWRFEIRYDRDPLERR
jgi:hypothetical protein